MLKIEHSHSSRTHWVVPALGVLVLVGLGFLVWSVWATTGTLRSSAPARSALTQTSTGGQVTIEATWQDSEAAPVFTIAMNTHSVELDTYDLRQRAVLRTDTGLEVQPVSWNAPAGGHHRSGTLTFPATSAAGTPVLGTNTHTIELMIRDVAGVPERSFRWTR